MRSLDEQIRAECEALDLLRAVLDDDANPRIGYARVGTPLEWSYGIVWDGEEGTRWVLPMDSIDRILGAEDPWQAAIDEIETRAVTVSPAEIRG